MISGIFKSRAGDFLPRVPIIFFLCRTSVPLMFLSVRTTLRLCVLTVCLLSIDRLVMFRTSIGITVFNTLSKGSIFEAIARAISGLTPRGMNSGNAAPDRCVVVAVVASAVCRCLFFDGWQPACSDASHSFIVCSTVTVSWWYFVLVNRPSVPV